MFGGEVFGALIFAEIDGVSVTPGRRGSQIGGSGFPANWEERLNRSLPSQADLDAEELEELVALGVV